MGSVASAHPAPERLVAFALGQIGDAEALEIEGHLASCPACCTTADSVEPDDFLLTLRGHSTPATDGTQPYAGPDPPSRELPSALRGHPRYEVLEFLGAGGMGAVYRARHVVMDRLVALKVLRPDLVANTDRLERFRREVQAAARLAHPNIVTAFDAERVDDMHFLVMEYVEGESLAEILERPERLPVPLACDYIRQAAEGLAHAHGNGLVHRDVKPHNLVLAKDGRVKILDFGLARLHGGRDETGGAVSVPGMVMGTPDYMAPEQGVDSTRADHRADIYGLGCTLYHLLAGQPPFAGSNALEKLLAHQTKVAAPLTELRGDVPGDLARVVERMMSKDADGRYQTAAEVAEALRPFAGGASPPGPRGKRWPGARKTRFLPVIAGTTVLAVAIVALALALLLLHRWREPRTLPGAPIRLRWDEKELRLGKISAPDLTRLELLREDEFTDPRSGFPAGVQALGGRADFNRFGYDRGRYFIETYSNLLASVRCEWGRFSQLACQTTCRNAGPGESRSGLALFNGQAGVEILVSSKGEYEIAPSRRLEARAQGLLPHIGPARHEAIRPDGQFNTLLVILRGQMLEVYVNGAAVCDPLWLDKDVTPCWIHALVVPGADAIRSKQKVRAEFERITLWSPEGIPLPQERGARQDR